MENKPSLFMPDPEKWNGRKLVIAALLMVLLGIALQCVSTLLLNAILPLFPETMEFYDELEAGLSELTYTNILYVGILAPVIEEIIFRFGILGLAYRFMPFWVANILQALLFGIYHGNVVQFAYAFILGLLIGYVVYRTRYFGFALILHMSINLSGLFLF